MPKVVHCFAGCLYTALHGHSQSRRLRTRFTDFTHSFDMHTGTNQILPADSELGWSRDREAVSERITPRCGRLPQDRACLGAPARQTNTSWLPAAVSSSRRSYRLCTRRDTAPHPGHDAARPHVRAWTRTVLPAMNTRSTSTSFRCGSRTSATSRSHGQHDHKRRDQGSIRHAGHLTKTVPEPVFRCR